MNSFGTPNKPDKENFSESSYQTPPSSPQVFQILSSGTSKSSELNTDNLSDVVNSVTKKLKWSNFCFTGGIALYYWAKEYNQEFTRDLKDIDIVTKDDLIRFMNVINSKSIPGPDSTHITGKIGEFSVDIISADKGLGTMTNACFVQDNVPVVSLEEMLKYKKLQIGEGQ